VIYLICVMDRIWFVGWRGLAESGLGGLKDSLDSAPGRWQGCGSVRLRGGCKLEADAELAEHVKGVEVGNVELLADVGDVDSFPGVWAIRFVRHHDGAMD